ncbi:MAG: hypothetical protein JSV21_10660 [Nitrospirota bacterium]|nr:MAG: hypothetical protein JSV21_10660 [Nitrospirota bacterium]
MEETTRYIQDELLDAFYSVISDLRLGLISDEEMKTKLLRLAERYERSVGLYDNDAQKGLFQEG